MTQKEHIKTLLSEGNTKEALDFLLSISDYISKNNVIKLKNRYHRVIDNQTKGILSHQDINIELNKINDSILSIIDENNEHKKLNLIIKLLIFAIFVSIIAVIVYKNLKKQIKKPENDAVTIVQVEVGILSTYYAYVQKDVVEMLHKKNPKYRFTSFNPRVEGYLDEPDTMYRFLNVSLNPIFGDWTSSYIYQKNQTNKYIPLYAIVKL